MFILKEISPEYSLEGLMLKLKLLYFGHPMRKTDSLEKTLMLGKIEGRPCNPNQKWRGTLRFLPQLKMRPSSIAPKPLESREVPPTHSVPDFSEAP